VLLPAEQGKRASAPALRGVWQWDHRLGTRPDEASMPWPQARHGHASVYVPEGAAAGDVVGKTHAESDEWQEMQKGRGRLFIFGGSSQACVPPGGPVLPESMKLRYGGFNGKAGVPVATNRPASCLLSDLWSLQVSWVRQRRQPSRLLMVDGRVPAASEVSYGALRVTLHGWSRVRGSAMVEGSVAPSVPLHSSEFASVETPRAIGSPPGSLGLWPGPRAHATMAWLGDGLVVYGGAKCSPGCTCLCDTWRVQLSEIELDSNVASTTESGRRDGCRATRADWTYAGPEMGAVSWGTVGGPRRATDFHSICGPN